MKVLVCGGRDFRNYALVKRQLDVLHSHCSIKAVIHGDAKGADTLAGEWARETGVQEVRCPANWDFYGVRAGHTRNKAMLSLSPDLVVAFPGGKGTSNMKAQARRSGIEVVEIREEQ